MTNLPEPRQPQRLNATKVTAQHVRWFLLGITLPLLAGLTAYKLLGPHIEPDRTRPANVDLTALSQQAVPELPLPDLSDNDLNSALVNTVEFVVRRNDTMEKIFRQLRLNLQDLATVRQLPEVKRALEMLKPGERITLNHSDGALQGLTRRLNDTSLLSITRQAEGFKAEVVETPLTVKVASAHGEVNSSFYASAMAAGLTPDMVLHMANDIFGWDIDFALEIRKGDEFSVIYEQQYRDAEYIGPGRILAAEFVNAGRTYRAVHYESADGKISNYFTPEGRSMRKQFLRAPVDFTRISSGFSLARLHPILNTIRAHKGVDYAAPKGTPIWAAGDGRVSFAGVKGGYGKVVIIEHSNGVSTLYGHMSAFAKSIRHGAGVEQGQTIGYVGSTGAATGPHLHYEYRVNGAHKNPRTIPTVNAAPISAEYLADFQRQTGQHLVALDRIGRPEVVAGPVSR